MKYTGNYKLKKPDGTDVVNVQDINDNMDVLDTEVKTLANAVQNNAAAETVSQINSKMGANTDASGTATLFARLRQIYEYLTANLSSARVSKIDNLDTTMSSRAPASTALSNTIWTNTRAGYLDTIPLNNGYYLPSNQIRHQKNTEYIVATRSNDDAIHLYTFLPRVDGVIKLLYDARSEKEGCTWRLYLLDLKYAHDFTVAPNGTSVFKFSIYNNILVGTLGDGMNASYATQVAYIPCKKGIPVTIGGTATNSSSPAYFRNARVCYDIVTNDMFL